MLFAFDDLVDDGLNELRWAVAYTSLLGSQKVTQRIIDRVGTSLWGRAEKTLVTSFDYGITDPEALTFLKDDIGVAVRVANVEVLGSSLLRPRNAFHPKMYLCRGSRIMGLVGSANLTDSAMTSNVEAGVIGRVPLATWENGWREIVNGAVELDDPLLARYREMRRRAPPSRPTNPDQRPSAIPINRRTRRLFWDEVEALRLDPQTFRNFWVEAGSMSSGGSHNQLELPRGANRYFGFSFQQYGHEHATIGHPRLTSFSRAWTNRPLTWHGNNGMERLNLPPRAQHGFTYPGTAVLFRRRVDGFELLVSPWNSSVALSWRNASALLGVAYRIGQRTTRICGLF
jgi:hypothetical protein